MSYQNTIAKTGALMAQANLLPALRALTDVRTRLAAEEAAFERIVARRDELSAEMQAARGVRSNADELANQFRAGEVEVKPTRHIEAIQAEIENVREASRKIVHGLEDLRSEEKRARADIAVALCQPLDKVEAAIIDRVDAAYRELAAAFVDAYALREAVMAPRVSQKLIGLRAVVEALQQNEHGFYRQVHTPSKGIVDAIDQHAEILKDAGMFPAKQVTLTY